jgi:phosphoglycolate phosphatase
LTAEAPDQRATLADALRPIRSLIFDLDGTLVDSYAAIRTALNAALAPHGIAARSLDEVRRAVGHGLEELLARYLPGEHVPGAVPRFRTAYREVVLRETFALPGAVETLSGLHRRGFGLSVASNKPVDFSREILEHLALAPFLRSIRGPEADVPPKPHPAMLTACVRDLAAAPDSCVYVGDMALDVESAARAGLGVLLVPTGSSSREALAATGAPVLSSLRDLLVVLGRDPPQRASAR